MSQKHSIMMFDLADDNFALTGKIYQSFEALEETLGALKMEEPLFMTYAAKKAFARDIMKTTNSVHQYRN